MKMKVKFVNGSWKNDDVDLLPSIKLRTGSKVDTETHLKVKATSVALCWLKWGVMITFGKVTSEKHEVIASKKDSEIFFEAVLNAEPPNEKLQTKINKYEK